MPSFIKRLSLRNSFQQRQSIHQDRRRTIRAIPFFQDFKIAIIGDECVGKSNIAMRCAGKETFVPEHEPTIEDEYNCKVQFMFRLPAPLVEEIVSNGGEGDSNELMRSNPKGDIYGYKQLAHDLELIPMELRNYMKLDNTLLSIIQQKREKEEEMKKALEEKQKKMFSLFKKKSTTSDSPQKSSHEHAGNNQSGEDGDFGRVITEEEDIDDYVDELLSDVVYNFEQDIICRVTIVDTSGRSEVRKEATDLSSVDGYMLVFDMNNKASFAKIQNYIDECKFAYYENPARKHSDAAASHSSSSARLSSASNNSSATMNSTSSASAASSNVNSSKPSTIDNPPMVLIMSKCDQKPSALKTINAEYGYALGDTHHFPFFVTSACENLNIQEALEGLLSEIIKKNIEEGVYETQNKSMPTPLPSADETLSKTNSRNFKFENQNISISSNASDYTPELLTFSVGNGVVPQSPPEKKIVRQSVSATLRKYVVQQFKKK
ncbi:predicted protein [Naegleria gruberi]|uniref:Predicted protein n=1 Tax=Naegleria gruberi TaxID=5762 RepID=D2V8X6_NAEGR|nr:uncharacterized protein NAEGRDRAFT_65318 [Naegleria gruberi]EFC46767.1 predicted protein [Naegleria gruberi]|eukprot:XP_002679511.1 predicted protein [Naegleria gruberi strain NEG-M]